MITPSCILEAAFQNPMSAAVRMIEFPENQFGGGTYYQKDRNDPDLHEVTGNIETTRIHSPIGGTEEGRIRWLRKAVRIVISNCIQDDLLSRAVPGRIVPGIIYKEGEFISCRPKSISIHECHYKYIHECHPVFILRCGRWQWLMHKLFKRPFSKITWIKPEIVAAFRGGIETAVNPRYTRAPFELVMQGCRDDHTMYLKIELMNHAGPEQANRGSVAASPNVS